MADSPRSEADLLALAAEVLAGIAPDADLATVGPDQDLRETLDLDSMDFLNFVIGLSARLGVAIPEADSPKLYTKAGLLCYLQAL